MINQEVLSEEVKRFKQLSEWSFVPQGIDEDNDDDNQNIPNGNNSDMPQNGIDDNMSADMMNQSNGNQNGVQDNLQNDMNIPPQENGTDMSNANGNQENLDNVPFDDETEKESEDDDVIDVTKLTDAQIKMNDKLKSFVDNMGNVNSSLTNLMGLIDTLDKKIDNSNSQIENLKKSIQERLPNEEEKIQKRAEDGFPFSNNPSDINSVHAKDPNASKNITASDVANYNNRDIEKSFDDIDDLRQDINRIFNY